MARRVSWAILMPDPALVLGLVFIVGTIVAGLVYVYLPHAQVTITPATIDKTVNQQILISTTVTDPDFVNYKLPARLLEKEAADRAVVERSAEVTGEDYARGKVVLYNEQDQEQQLLPKTHLRHQETNTYFLTDTGVAIPPRSEIGVTVTAKEKGASGNVPAGRFIVDKLPLSLQDAVYGESKQVFSGGLAVDTPLTEDELVQAKDKLKTELTERVRGLLTAMAGGAALNNDLINLADDIESSISSGSAASQFEVGGKVVGKAFLLDENDLLGLTLLKLRSTAEAQQEFVEYNPQSFKVVMIRSDWERGEAVVEGSLTGSFSTKLSANVFKADNLAGLSAAEVQEKLKQLPGVGEVSVALKPFWVSAIPARSGAVKIEVKDQ